MYKKRGDGENARGSRNVGEGRRKGSGVEGRRVWNEKEEGGRRSKDRRVNKERRRLMEFIEEKGWKIFNGNIEGDEEGEFIFTGGKGTTVIDYVLRSKVTKEKIRRMRIGKEVDSDHQPIELVVRGKRDWRRRTVGGKRRWRGRWDEEGQKKFVERVDKLDLVEKDILKNWKGKSGKFWKG